MKVKNNLDTVKVIYRTFSILDGGDTIAIFPEIIGTNDPVTCDSYQHLGQHGSCNPNHLISITRPSTFEEKEELAKELEAIGYSLKEVKKLSKKYFESRCKQLAKFNCK